jgi:hypothetical protein
MPTQKTLKRRVRTRMTKTGESYTAARRQVLRKSEAVPAPVKSLETAPPTGTAPGDAAPAGNEPSVSDAAIRRATGRSHDEWFAILDGWGATGRRHTEIARWLRDTQGVDGWWSQSITVDYERARGMRERHQMSDGFTVGATRTIAVDADRLLAAFTRVPTRKRWLPGVALRQRPTRAALTARFDWPDPPSRVVVGIVPKGPGKSVVAVQHEQLPDAAIAETFKGAWRVHLGSLKAFLEGPGR